MRTLFHLSPSISSPTIQWLPIVGCPVGNQILSTPRSHATSISYLAFIFHGLSIRSKIHASLPRDEIQPHGHVYPVRAKTQSPRVHVCISDSLNLSSSEGNPALSEKPRICTTYQRGLLAAVTFFLAQAEAT